MPKSTKKSKCAKFIKVLYSMTKNLESHLKWSSDQTYFTITNILGFIQTSLNTYFKHSNLSSFIRQLNLYGFKKLPTTSQTPENSYYHQFFKRGQSHLLSKIQRRFIKKSSRTGVKSSSFNSSSDSGESKKQHYISKLQQCQDQLKKLRQQNYKLAQENGALKLSIKQEQAEVTTKQNFGFTQFNKNYDQFQSRVFGLNPFQINNIGWPFVNINTLEQLSNMNRINPSASVNSYDNGLKQAYTNKKQ